MASTPVPQQASASPMPEGVTDPNYQPLPGMLGNLTVIQHDGLEKLRKELQEEGAFVPERMDDAMLLRFLRRHEFDHVKAKEMLLDAEKWRKEFGVDNIVKNFDYKEKEEVDKILPQYYHKTDKDGRPVYILRFGNFDINALYITITRQRQLQLLVFQYEELLTKRWPACAKAIGHPVETCCTILDLNGEFLSNFLRIKDYFQKAAEVGQNRYPETMGKIYIINAPNLFSQMVWPIIKPWMDPVSASKVQILGSEYEEALLKQIPKENLPVEFGGTCVCEGRCSMADAGPWNPKPQVEVQA